MCLALAPPTGPTRRLRWGGGGGGAGLRDSAAAKTAEPELDAAAAATATATAAGQVHSLLPRVALSPVPWGKAGKVLGAAGQGLPRVSRSPHPLLPSASPQQCCLLQMQNLGQEWGCPRRLSGRLAGCTER